ncbi:MAG: YdcF family protein [Bacilli bacterium]|nr:YdcF family protein [Bacilli bacterium]
MKVFKKIILLIMIFILLIFITSLFVKIKTTKYISDNLPSSKKYDYIIVLGSAVYNGKPRAILEARLKKAIDLYQKGVASKILMTGDHKDDGYNEVDVMKNYAIENGVAEDDIILDHLGLSTYDSIYRAINIFQIKKAVIVSQKYHLYRAIYIAKAYGIDAYGVWSETTNDRLQIIREIREILARDKDYIKTLFKVRSSI